MDVKSQLKWMSATAIPILFAFTIPAQADITKKKPMIIAGPIGKSSSASARVTLVIPPKRNTASQSGSQQKASEKPAKKTTQKKP